MTICGEFQIVTRQNAADAAKNDEAYVYVLPGDNLYIMPLNFGQSGKFVPVNTSKEFVALRGYWTVTCDWFIEDQDGSGVLLTGKTHNWDWVENGPTVSIDAGPVGCLHVDGVKLYAKEAHSGEMPPPGDDPVQEANYLFTIYPTLYGLQVFDPKLEPDATEDVFPQGAPDGIPDCPIAYRAVQGLWTRITVMDGVTEVAAILPKTQFSGTDTATTYWNGKWGQKQDGTDSDHKGKFADPGSYVVKIEVFKDEALSELLGQTSYTSYVVRLGVTEIQFTAMAAGTFHALQYQFKDPDDDDDGLSQAGDKYLVPDAQWRIGDETSNDRNVDITSGDDSGKRRDEVTPNSDIFAPPRDADGVATVEDDSYNYQVCYDINSKIRMLIRVGDAAYSQVLDRVLAAGELGIGACPYHVNLLMGTALHRDAGPQPSGFDAQPNDSNKHIAAGQVITLDSQQTLADHVGKEPINVNYKFTYTDNGQDITIPGHYGTSHTIYRIISAPKGPWAAVRPWVGALDYATTWADGDQTEHEAAKKVTEAINGGLGRGIQYDLGAGASNYGAWGGPLNDIHWPLRLANFLLFVRDDAANADSLYSGNPANVVACPDCGALTTAFSTILGADLSATQINQSHKLNEINAIGHPGWGRPFPGGGFSFHCFATRVVDGDNMVYDACLKVGRPDPQNPVAPPAPRIGLLPTGMPFDIDPAAGSGAVVAGGTNAGNGTLVVADVFEENTMNDEITVTCTAVDAGTGAATFTATSNRSGTGDGEVGGVAGNNVDITLTRNVRNTVKVTITQGTVRFAVGDSFSFNTTFNYDEYRGSLAAPDAEFGVAGRSAATITKKYALPLE